MLYYKNEDCYRADNLQKEMYLGYSITKVNRKLCGSAILRFRILMTSCENKEFAPHTDRTQKLIVTSGFRRLEHCIKEFEEKICTTFERKCYKNSTGKQICQNLKLGEESITKFSSHIPRSKLNFSVALVAFFSFVLKNEKFHKSKTLILNK